MNRSEIPTHTSSQEIPREKYIEQLLERALAEISYRFDTHPEGTENYGHKKDRVLDFHNSEHTKDIIRRTKTILETIQGVCPELVDTTAIEDGQLAAAFHDMVQEWREEIVTEELGGLPIFKIIRKKESEKNELKSAIIALSFLDRIEEETGTDLFSPTSMGQVQEAIMTTVPSFKYGTVIQKNLTERSSPVARALALADIGAAGIDGPEIFISTGDALFREDNLDISRAIVGKEPLSEKQRRYFSNRMKNWSIDQIAFAEGRKKLFESEVAPLPEKARVAVRAVFSKFDETILSVKTCAEKRKTMSFEELTVDMGYKI